MEDEVVHGNLDEVREAEKQTNKVKRPMNAFMLWSKEKRRKLSSIDPSLHNSSISKILGEEWKHLPIKDKDPYIKESKSLMDKHKKEHPNYHYKPRQNKLAKTLKQLSSLHSTFSTSTPPGFATKLRSLTNMPAFVNVPRSACYGPYVRGVMMHRAASKYHTTKHAADESASMYYGEVMSDVNYLKRPLNATSAANPACSGCTCKDYCVLGKRWMESQQRYIADHLRYLAATTNFAGRYGNSTSHATTSQVLQRGSADDKCSCCNNNTDPLSSAAWKNNCFADANFNRGGAWTASRSFEDVLDRASPERNRGTEYCLKEETCQKSESSSSSSLSSSLQASVSDRNVCKDDPISSDCSC
eukprot:gene10737-11886_t